MNRPNAGGDEDSISALSYSSCISYEVDPFLVLEEMSKKADYDSEDSDSDSDSDDEGEPIPRCPDDNLLHKDIEAEIDTVSRNSLGSSKAPIQRIISDLSLSSLFKEKEEQSNSTPTRLKRSKPSVLSMFEKRIIDREVKAGKIDRAGSMGVLSSGRNSMHRTGSAYSFKSRLSSCEVIREDAESNCYQNATFGVFPHQIPSHRRETSVPAAKMSLANHEALFSSNATEQRCAVASSVGHAMLGAESMERASRRRSHAASKMGHAMLEASTSNSASRRRGSVPPLMIHLPSNDVPSLTSLIKGLRLGFENELAPKQNRRGSVGTLDTDAMTDFNLSTTS